MCVSLSLYIYIYIVMIIMIMEEVRQLLRARPAFRIIVTI